MYICTQFFLNILNTTIDYSTTYKIFHFLSKCKNLTIGSIFYGSKTI